MIQTIAQFVLDFTRTFFSITSYALIALVELTAQIVYMFQKIYVNIIVPFMFEVMADVHYIVTVICQSMMSALCDFTLMLSKWLLKVSQLAHDKSEELIHRSWMN